MTALTDRQTKFRAYHYCHPLVWIYFNRYCRRLRDAGNARFSQRMVWEAMRLDFLLEAGEDKFKLNNNYTKDYAEMYMKKNPDFIGFETRTKGKTAGPSTI